MAARIPRPPAYRNPEVLYGDKELYARIGKVAGEEGGKSLVENFEIPIRSGKAWVVKRGKRTSTHLLNVVSIGSLLLMLGQDNFVSCQPRMDRK